MSSIGVVVNRRAGRNRGVLDRAGRLEHLLGTSGWMRETASLEHLADVAAECRARAVDLLGVCGGDGMLARTLSAFVRAYGGKTLPRIVSAPRRHGDQRRAGHGMPGVAARAHARGDRRHVPRRARARCGGASAALRQPAQLRICVLEHARVLEDGRHDELMARGGRYRTMFELQAKRFTAAADEEGVAL